MFMFVHMSTYIHTHIALVDFCEVHSALKLYMGLKAYICGANKHLPTRCHSMELLRPGPETGTGWPDSRDVP